MPLVAPPPGMLFTITPFFNWGFIPSATARAAVSLPPPGAEGDEDFDGALGVVGRRRDPSPKTDTDEQHACRGKAKCFSHISPL